MFKGVKTSLCALVVGALAGCKAPEPKKEHKVDFEKLEVMIDSLSRMVNYHDGKILMTHRDYSGAAREFTRAINEKDNAMYRIARFNAYIRLASVQEDMDEKKYSFARSHADADAYIRFLPNEPDGYLAKVLTFYEQSKTIGISAEKIEKAKEFLAKIDKMITKEKRQLRHFSIDGARKLYKKMHAVRSEY